MILKRKPATTTVIATAIATTPLLCAAQSQTEILNDVGPAVCEAVRLGMQTTEPEWHDKLQRGYQWWPHWFKQRVTADPADESFGIAVTKVNIESGILEDVPANDSTMASISAINLHATTSAVIYLPESKQVVSYSNLYAHQQNKPVTSGMALIAVANQAAETADIAEAVQQILGGELALSMPTGGSPRRIPDDMLNIDDVEWIPAGENPSVYLGDACMRAKREAGMMSLLTNADEIGLTGEFPWEKDSVPTMIKVARGDENPRSETVMLRMDPNYRHPRLGNGMHIILALPLPVPDDTGPKIANQLNLAERLETSHAHQLGAWAYLPQSMTVDVLIPFAKDIIRLNGNAGTLIHVAFLPNGVYFPGIASVMFQSSAMRSRWAKNWIDKNTNLRLPSNDLRNPL